MNKKTSIFALSLITMLSSCVSLGNTAAPPAFLVLTAQSNIAGGTVNTADTSNALVVRIPDAPRKIDTNRIPVQVSDSSIAYIKDAFWADKPAHLMRQLIAETIAAKTGQLVLDDAQSGGKTKRYISGTLSEFGLDERGSFAIVRYDAVKFSGDNIVEKRRFEARRDVSNINASQAGIALNEAANEVAIAIATWSQ